MKYLINSIFCVALLFCNDMYSQYNKVASGPMISFIDAYSTQVWFLLEPDAETIKINLTNYQNDKLLEYNFDVVNEYNLEKYIPFTVVLENLLPNREYIASVYVDDIFIKELDLFTKRPHLDDVQLLIGYGLGDYHSEKMFANMINTNSDFMVWLGGHVDFGNPVSFQGMLDNYIDVRKKDILNDFLSSMPQIATWGETDFGIKNIKKSWLLRDSAYTVFDLFWPNSLNKTYNYTFYDYGAYQRYSYNDVDLFLLDSETFNYGNTLYGDKQIERLFQELKNTGATFTIIASPCPFTFESKNSYLNYTKKFDYFMYRLKVSGLDGVILVSGNSVSGTRLNQYTIDNYTVNELNISSLDENNYSLINISGLVGDRKLSFNTYNENGNLIYRKYFHQNDLVN